LHNCHEVFIPFTDVFRLGGSEVFKQLGAQDGKKNLIVLPMALVDRLEEGTDLNETERRFQGGGAKDTLRYLKGIKGKAEQVEPLEDGAMIYHLSPTLAVASLDHDGKEFSIKDLENKVTQLFPSSREDKRPTLITAKARDKYKFESRGMRVEEPDFLLEGPDIVNEGILEGSAELQAKLQEKQNSVSVDIASDLLGRQLYMHQFIQFMGGDFAVVTGNYRRNKSGSRIIGIEDQIVRLLPQSEKSKRIRIGSEGPAETVLGIKPLDMEQYLAFQHVLMDPEVELAFVSGGAGSGKTVLSYAAAVDQVLRYDKEYADQRGHKANAGRYKKIVLLKPFEIMGGSRRDVGFLPGSLYEKIKRQLDSYADAHNLTDLVKGKTHISFEEMFLHPKFANDFGKMRSEQVNNAKINGCAHMPKNEVIELTYSGFLRGRSFHNTLVLVDEAQNFTPYEIKTIIARMGPGCKVIVMGDHFDQIDNPLCSPEINGLTHSIREFLPRNYSALIPLRGLHRSQMAEDAHNWNSVYQQ
jgi:predicted ribonuclease YlaK